VSEHFPKSTLTATAWCLKCNRNTEHRIDDGRVGPCLDEAHPATPSTKAKIPKLDLGKQPEQKGLFDK
jgi:hypothetical protein